MRRFLALALFAGAIGYSAPAANACHFDTPWIWYCWLHPFYGEAAIDCFGCGVSSGTAALWVAPAVPGLDAPNTFATYTVIEIPSQCPITGSATGSTTGAMNVTFSWTRVGATALITTTGDVNGGGAAGFVVTDPVGNPCGGPVRAQVVGAIAGV